MPARIARRLDAGHLHAKADAEIRNLAFAGEFGGQDLAFRAALAKAAGHQNAVDLFEVRRRIFLFEDFRLDPFELDLAPGWPCRHATALRSAICRRPSGRCICRRWRWSLRLPDCGCARRPPCQRSMRGFGAGSMPKAASTSESRPSL